MRVGAALVVAGWKVAPGSSRLRVGAALVVAGLKVALGSARLAVGAALVVAGLIAALGSARLAIGAALVVADPWERPIGYRGYPCGGIGRESCFWVLPTELVAKSAP